MYHPCITDWSFLWRIQWGLRGQPPTPLPSCIFPTPFLPTALLCWTAPPPMKILDLPLHSTNFLVVYLDKQLSLLSLCCTIITFYGFYIITHTLILIHPLKSCICFCFCLKTLFIFICLLGFPNSFFLNLVIY